MGAIKNTHIFSGTWDETITLDKEYDALYLSGRNLLAKKGNEVYAFNIQDCTQEMPTQTPTLSPAPTTSPTFSFPPRGLFKRGVLGTWLKGETRFDVERPVLTIS